MSLRLEQMQTSLTELRFAEGMLRIERVRHNLERGMAVKKSKTERKAGLTTIIDNLTPEQCAALLNNMESSDD